MLKLGETTPCFAMINALGVKVHGFLVFSGSSDLAGPKVCFFFPAEMIVRFPTISLVIFHRYVTNYQRVRKSEKPHGVVCQDLIFAANGGTMGIKRGIHCIHEQLIFWLVVLEHEFYFSIYWDFHHPN